MARYVGLLMTILLCVGFIGCKGHSKESLNEQGKALFEQGNFNGAIVHYKNALEKDPNFVDARFNLGLAYLETGKLEQAEREFQKVQLQNPHDNRVGFELARIANFQNKPAVAVALLMAYLKEKPNDAAAIEQLAFSATISGDFASAREYLLKALSLENGRISSKLALIHNYMSQGDRGEARKAIDALLTQDPNNRAGLHALAQLEAQEKDPEAMLDVYARISSTYPTDLFARYKEGSLLINKGEGDTAKASALAMIKEYPDKAEGHRLLGMYLSREGKYEEAVTSLSKSLRIQPDLETYYLLGLAYFHLGNLEMAVNQFQTVLDYNPGFAQARVMQGEIFLRQKRGAEALLVANKMIEMSADDFRAHALKGDALLLQGEPREALVHFEKATSLAPSNYGLLLKVGLVKLSLGDTSGENSLLSAMKVSPQAVDARMALHSFYLRNGRGDEALTVLTEGLSGGKSDAVLFNALAKASLGRRDAEGAEEYLAKARAADPGFLQTYYNAATFMFSMGKLDEAVAQYDLALGVSPGDVLALSGSAAILDKQGKTDEALSRLEKARATGDPGAILMLSAFLQQHGKSDEALTVLDDELRKKPANMGLILAKAKLHILRKEPDKAMTLYGQLEAADQYAGAMERTRAWMALGDIDKAEESARRMVRFNPNKAQSYVLLATIFEMRKDRAGAESELVKGLAAEPKNTQVGLILADFQLHGRDLEKAMGSYDKVLAIAPTNVQALTGKGMTLQMLDRNDEAAKLYLQAVQAQHDYVPALNNLAMLWADNERTRLQALNLAMAALVRASGDPSVVDTLGYVLIRNNRSEEALKVLERALSMAPDRPVIQYHHALALSELGRTNEAIASLEKVLAGGNFNERADAQKLLRKLNGG